jgi:MFS family permease
VADESRVDGSSVLTARQRRSLTRVTSDRAKIATLAATGLIAASLQTIVTPIYPRLPELLNASPADVSWVFTATLLVAVISMPISGRLGDMYGKRRTALLVLLIVAAGSVVCALSDSLPLFIAGRAMQGVGLGVVPLGISILRDVLHPKSLGGAVALVSATLGVGGAVGLPAAAAVAQAVDWHWLFWIAAAMSVLALIAVAAVIPVSTLRSGGRFDLLGAIALAIGLVGILLAVSKGHEWGWDSLVTLGLLFGGLIVLVGFGFFELRVSDPIIDLRVAARRPVLLTNLTSVTVGFAFFVFTGTMPTLLEAPVTSEIGLGLSLIRASLCLMPLGLVMFFISPLAARLTAARGPRTSFILGMVVLTVAFCFAVFFLDEVWQILLMGTIAGVGIGFAYAAMPNLIMRSVPPRETAAANGLNAVMRTLGSTISATVAAVILAANLVVTDGVATPSRQAFSWVYMLAAGVLVCGVVLAILIPRRTQTYDTSSIPVQQP